MKFFKNSSLAFKLMATTFLGGLSLLFVGAINFVTLQQVLTKYDHIATINLPNSDSLGALTRRSSAIAVQLMMMADAVTANSPTEGYIDKVQEHIGYYEKYQKIYEDIEFVPGEAEIWDPIEAQWKALKEKIHEAETLVESKDPSKRSQVLGVVEKMIPDIINHVEDISKLIEFQRQQSEHWTAAAKSAASIGQLVGISAILVFFLLGSLVGIYLARTINKSLRGLAEELDTNADEVANASQSLSATAQELSQATTEQAASIEETAASIEEMASMVSKNSENSVGTAKLATESHNNATRGEHVVKTMIDSMNEINKSNQNIMTAINQSNNEISEITKVIAEIGNKTKVINDIVFQTKLLSFNASVEAARAGEHGKGFAVVAEEVGNLAQMSGNAAKEISTMLNDSIEKVERIVQNTQNHVEKLIEEGRAKVEQGTHIAHQCGDVLHEIVDNVAKVKKMADEISAASNEQSKGVSEISKAMNQLDHVTQQNAQVSDATASASEQLSGQAVGLRNAVINLRVEIEGQGKVPHHVPMKTSPAKTPSRPENVISLKSKTTLGKAKTNKHSTLKLNQKVTEVVAAKTGPATSGSQAVGSSTPAFDDSRFEDV